MAPLLATKPSGDRAFEQIYRLHVPDVYRYALMVLRNPADAEDVTQTTFLNAYRAMQKGEEPRNPRNWLIRIAHNTCRTRFRDGQRRPQEVELDERLAAAAPLSDDGVPSVDEVLQALGHLSLNQRAALVMRELEGRSYAEIAQVLEVSTSAVETLIFRARRALREQLEGALTCGQAELALSRELDGRLDADEKGTLRAHLRECKECASLARRQRARRAALRSLGPVPLPASLAPWSGTGAAVGTSIAVKIAASLAAGVLAAGAVHEAGKKITSPRGAAAARPAAVQPETTSLVEPTGSTLLAASAGRSVPGVGARGRVPFPGGDVAAPVMPAAPLPAAPEGGAVHETPTGPALDVPAAAPLPPLAPLPRVSPVDLTVDPPPLPVDPPLPPVPPVPPLPPTPALPAVPPVPPLPPAPELPLP